MTEHSFIKMHGLGNDFVVLDARRMPFSPSRKQILAIADRRLGVGCDQVISVAPASNNSADISMKIWNADGGEVEACGNASRCVAAFIMAEKNTQTIAIETTAGLLRAERRDDGQIAVNMGPARLDWRDIPLSQPQDTLHLDISAGPLVDPVAVSMGNPHAIFFVENIEAVDLEALGPEIETHPLFPQRVNVGIVQVLSKTSLRFRVWERGCGITPACGTGACAALVSAARRGLSERRAMLTLDGGELEIEWMADDHVLMTGPTVISFTGVLDQALLS
jgi:diaminopimelate epimerase